MPKGSRREGNVKTVARAIAASVESWGKSQFRQELEHLIDYSRAKPVATDDSCLQSPKCRQ